MNIAMFLIGGLILLSFPFIVLEKSKKVKQENTEEAKKKFNKMESKKSTRFTLD